MPLHSAVFVAKFLGKLGGKRVLLGRLQDRNKIKPMEKTVLSPPPPPPPKLFPRPPLPGSSPSLLPALPSAPPALSGLRRAASEPHLLQILPFLLQEPHQGERLPGLGRGRLPLEGVPGRQHHLVSLHREDPVAARGHVQLELGAGGGCWGGERGRLSSDLPILAGAGVGGAGRPAHRKDLKSPVQGLGDYLLPGGRNLGPVFSVISALRANSPKPPPLGVGRGGGHS